ncbi:DUF3515 domain-containing protein [Mycobacterium kansasii]|uniref:DUF3515 domain-containing protein n=1 Tax=Mycobacterium kansasii TaxID=1768 RepID=UPI000CDD31AE|nr:DUF3515 domain-containing protein [Mycobacterium kansasii]POY09747.1 DUF3515 domain-containing protein [Mycobacterium kansasii]POY24181.1 DUF3515 domain-containing protein [Mycobacterium kansasii]POY32984.1 DUF3515 domain-containing protein [Mycobacterium kansasii]
MSVALGQPGSQGESEVAGEVTGDAPPNPEAEVDGPPRILIIAAVVLAVATVGVILVIAATRHTSQQPVTVAAVPAPHAGSPACRALTAALPQHLGDYQRVTIAQPAPEGASAWSSGPGREPVIMRCGLDRPADFVVGAPIQIVDRVQWFRVTDETPSEARSTWYTVDRPVYVALTLPAGSGPTPIQELSEVIDRTIAAVPIDPAPTG